MTARYLIIGLGNPGHEYAKTKHNVGFMCVDTLAHAHGLTFEKKYGKTLVASGTIAGKQVLLGKPQSYMNLSGDPVSDLVNFYKIPPQHLLVVFDDLDLPLGTLRIRELGGSSGHKGMKHIIERLGTQGFSRIRFGIGRPPGRMDPAAYVLQPFAPGDESILVAETVERASRAIEVWLKSGIERTMNEFNGSAEDAARRQSAATQAALINRTAIPGDQSADSRDNDQQGR